MAAAMLAQNDLGSIADGRVIEQFKDSTKLRALIDLFIAEATLAQDAIWTMLEGFRLELADGWALDIIGAQVGLPRPTIDAALFGFFGYLGGPNAQSYGDQGAPEVGGRYLSAHRSTTGNVLMEDEDYRAHIRGKIIRNQCSATPEDALAIIVAVIGVAGLATAQSTGAAHLSIFIGRALSTIERAYFLVDDMNGTGDRMIPRPLGVSVDYADTVGPF